MDNVARAVVASCKQSTAREAYKYTVPLQHNIALIACIDYLHCLRLAVMLQNCSTISTSCKDVA
jgi:hypothetical protein